MSATDVFTCDVAAKVCTPVQTPAVPVAAYPDSGSKWSSTTTYMGSGYTTDQPNDYLGVGFTGVEGGVIAICSSRVLLQYLLIFLQVD